jgi:hypothetical protein
MESESLRDTQEQIELWSTGNDSLSTPGGTPTIEELYICYGTVSGQTSLLAPVRFLLLSTMSPISVHVPCIAVSSCILVQSLTLDVDHSYCSQTLWEHG